MRFTNVCAHKDPETWDDESSSWTWYKVAVARYPARMNQQRLADCTCSVDLGSVELHMLGRIEACRALRFSSTFGL